MFSTYDALCPYMMPNTGNAIFAGITARRVYPPDTSSAIWCPILVIRYLLVSYIPTWYHLRAHMAPPCNCHRHCSVALPPTATHRGTEMDVMERPAVTPVGEKFVQMIQIIKIWIIKIHWNYQNSKEDIRILGNIFNKILKFKLFFFE